MAQSSGFWNFEIKFPDFGIGIAPNLKCESPGMLCLVEATHRAELARGPRRGGGARGARGRAAGGWDGTAQ